MDIRITQHDSGALIELTERLDASTADELDSATDNLLDQGLRHVVVNLRKVEHVDSVGLRQLLNLRSRVANLGGSVILTRVGEGLKNALDVAGMARAFRIVETPDAAFEALFAEREGEQLADRVSRLLRITCDEAIRATITSTATPIAPSSGAMSRRYCQSTDIVGPEKDYGVSLWRSTERQGTLI